MDVNAKSPMDDIKKLGEILMRRTSEKGKRKNEKKEQTFLSNGFHSV